MSIDYTKRPAKPAAEPASAPINVSKPAPAAPPPAPPPAAPASATSAPVSLGKVTLTKSAPSVSLTKGGAGGILRVNLNWTARPDAPAGAPAEEKKGFLKKIQAAAEQRMASGAIDLDLACLYEYSDGSKGVVQALGNAFRDQHTFGPDPICWLDGDDRSGTVSGGENLYVNLAHAAAIRRVLVFAFIYQGIPNWAAADAVVTMFPAEGGQIEMRLDEADNKAPLCSIALLTNDGSGIKVNREIKYIHGAQSMLDKEYGWGMNWARGSK
ncbi:MAG: TerD family protein [Sporichthyaceae bacterium]